MLISSFTAWREQRRLAAQRVRWRRADEEMVRALESQPLAWPAPSTEGSLPWEPPARTCGVAPERCGPTSVDPYRNHLSFVQLVCACGVRASAHYECAGGENVNEWVRRALAHSCEGDELANAARAARARAGVRMVAGPRCPACLSERTRVYYSCECGWSASICPHTEGALGRCVSARGSVAHWVTALHETHVPECPLRSMMSWRGRGWVERPRVNGGSFAYPEARRSAMKRRGRLTLHLDGRELNDGSGLEVPTGVGYPLRGAYYRPDGRRPPLLYVGGGAEDWAHRPTRPPGLREPMAFMDVDALRATRGGRGGVVELSWDVPLRWAVDWPRVGGT